MEQALGSREGETCSHGGEAAAARAAQVAERWRLKVRLRGRGFSTQQLAQDAFRQNKDASSQSSDALGFFCCCLLKNQLTER